MTSPRKQSLLATVLKLKATESICWRKKKIDISRDVIFDEGSKWDWKQKGVNKQSVVSLEPDCRQEDIRVGQVLAMMNLEGEEAFSQCPLIWILTVQKAVQASQIDEPDQ